MQDTAYESLLKSRRQILHQRIAEALRTGSRTVAEAEPELIAHHFTQAGLSEPAIDIGQGGRPCAAPLGVQGGDRASEQGDRDDGGRGRGGDREWGSEADAAGGVGQCIDGGARSGSAETKAIFERVQVLAAGDADIVKRSSAYFGVWAGRYVRGDLGAMREQVDIFLRDVADHPNPSMEGLANRICGGTHWFAGDFATAGIYLDKALALFDPGRDPALPYQFSHDFGTSAMIEAAMARWPLGEVDRARRHADEMSARLEQVPHSGTAALANTYAAVFELIRRDPARTAPRAAAVASLARTHEMAQWKAYGQYFEGWAEWAPGPKTSAYRRC